MLGALEARARLDVAQGRQQAAEASLIMTQELSTSSKVDRLLEQMLGPADNLAALAGHLGIVEAAQERLLDAFLKQLLQAAVVPHTQIAKPGSLNLLQTLLNILQGLDAEEEAIDAFSRVEYPEGWDDRNPDLAMLLPYNGSKSLDGEETELISIPWMPIRFGIGCAYRVRIGTSLIEI